MTQVIITNPEQELVKLKAKVKMILSKDIEARNNDNWLIIKYWILEGITEFNNTNGNAVTIILSRLKTATSAESITRVRKEIQNTDGELPPTHAEVLYHRGIKEEVIKRHYGENSTIYQEWQGHKYGIM